MLDKEVKSETRYVNSFCIKENFSSDSLHSESHSFGKILWGTFMGGCLMDPLEFFSSVFLKGKSRALT